MAWRAALVPAVFLAAVCPRKRDLCFPCPQPSAVINDRSHKRSASPWNHSLRRRSVSPFQTTPPHPPQVHRVQPEVQTANHSQPGRGHIRHYVQAGRRRRHGDRGIFSKTLDERGFFWRPSEGGERAWSVGT